MKGISNKRAARTAKLRDAIRKDERDNHGLNRKRAASDIQPIHDASNTHDIIGPAYGFKVVKEEKQQVSTGIDDNTVRLPAHVDHAEYQELRQQLHEAYKAGNKELHAKLAQKHYQLIRGY